MDPETPRPAVALSGGGHRAALFGLGVLLYLVDAEVNPGIGSVASVSGGSLTNGYVAQELDYSKATSHEFWELAGRLTRQIALRGTLWAAWVTRIYALLLFLSAVPLVVVWFVPTDLGRRLLLFVAAVFLFFVIAGARGWVCARSFGRTLYARSRWRRTRLRELHQNVDHVLCAADLHAGEHVYFSGRFVCSWRFGWGEPGDLALHSAVQASASYPGGFPARWFKARRHRFREPGDPRAARSRYLVLVDGGAYDNMADEWGQEVNRRNDDWAQLDPGLNEPDTLIIVNSSAPLGWRSLRSLSVPILGEILTLKRDIDVLYDTTTSTRRRWLFDTFTAEGRLLGAIVQISQSPFDVARSYAASPHDDEHKRRAQAVLSTLAGTEAEWQQIIRSTKSVKTTLNKLGAERSAQLVQHGYVLAMANLHVILGYPLLPVPAPSRFADLTQKGARDST
jgi:predicted acylesterase/phospholipase RssA